MSDAHEAVSKIRKNYIHSLLAMIGEGEALSASSYMEKLYSGAHLSETNQNIGHLKQIQMEYLELLQQTYCLHHGNVEQCSPSQRQAMNVFKRAENLGLLFSGMMMVEGALAKGKSLESLGILAPYALKILECISDGESHQEHAKAALGAVYPENPAHQFFMDAFSFGLSEKSFASAEASFVQSWLKGLKSREQGRQ